ncbi:MAG: MarR family transcriptional regulator [Nocardioides sp.]|nr:MarR family transcriptional regulator [Nocardioides sp.]
MADTGDLLMSAARALRRRHGDAMRQWDLAPGQSRALRIVHELEAARLSVLAERLHIAPRSATEVVDALEERGLVLRTADPTDRRATTVSLTTEGHRMLGVVEQARHAAFTRFFADLTADDRRELDRILHGLADT